MDTYRQQEQSADVALSREKTAPTAHVSDNYNPKIRPRDAHPDTVDAEERVSRNLGKLNRELVEAPAATEDSGARVETRSAKSRAAAPVSVIFSCVIVAVVFMYMLSLNVKVEEYSKSISELQGDITQLKEEATQLEVQLESRYDLDEVERIATEEYGMVSADSLPKKYISVSEGDDVLQVQPGAEEGSFHSLLNGLINALQELLS